MKVIGTRLRGEVPVFQVEGPQNSPLSKAWGSVFNDGVWRCPAYYPFGLWAAEGLAALPWDPSAQELQQSALNARSTWALAQSAWDNETDVALPVDDAYFPAGFTPYKHQRLGMVRLLQWWRTLLLWEMGTGKTRTVIDSLRMLRDQGEFRQAIVLAPPVILDTWARETQRCSQGAWKTVVWDGKQKTERAAQEADIVLVTYARARLERERAAKAVAQLRLRPDMRERYKLPPLTEKLEQELRWAATHPLRQLPYNVIVADESHYLGNWRSQQTQAAADLATKAARRICLTGTPGDDPRKLYGQLSFLSPALLNMSYHAFEERYLARSTFNKHIVVGFRHLDEINTTVSKVAMRMKKIDCLDLPPVTVQDFYYVLGRKQVARYNELVQELRVSMAPIMDFQGDGPAAAAPSLGQLLANGATRVNKLRQVISGFVTLGKDYGVCDTCPHMLECVEARIKPYTNRCVVVQEAPPVSVLRDTENPKLDLFKELAAEVLRDDPTNKVIVWASFLEELNDLVTAAKDLGVGYVRVDGSTTHRIGVLQDQFQQDPDCRIYIGQVSSGIGVTLTAANYTIYYAIPWDPLQYRQSMDRNHRPGQTRPVTVYRLLSDNSTYAIDRTVARGLLTKTKVSLTMSEVVACTGCERQLACEATQTLPFETNCKYAADVVRTIAKARSVD